MATLPPTFQRMAEASPLAMVIWDIDGRIYEANEAFFRLLGFQGTAPPDFNYWALTAAAQKQREISHLLTRENEAYEKEFVTPSGESLSVRVSGFAMERSDARTIFAALMRPAQQVPQPIDGVGGVPVVPHAAAMDAVQLERLRAEHDHTLRRQNAVLLKLARSPALESGDFKAAMRAITEAAALGLAVSRVSLWLFDVGRKRIVCQGLYELELKRYVDTIGATTQVALLAADYPSYFRALAEDRVICADDAATHPATHEFASGYLGPLQIYSMLEAPLRHKGELVGVLCHEHRYHRRTWTQDEVSFAGHMADFVAHAMEASDRLVAERALHQLNQELEQRVDERARQLEEATELVLRMQKERTEAQMAAGFAQEMRGALGPASAVLNKVLARSETGESTGQEPALSLSAQLHDLYMTLKDRLDEQTTHKIGQLMDQADRLSEAFAAVQRPVERALKITKDITEYSLVGGSHAGHDACAMAPIIQRILEELLPRIEQDQIHVTVELHGPLRLLGSEQHLRAAVRNVLLNACDALAEVPPPRRKRLLVRYQSVPAGAVINIEDNGDGMTEEIQRRLFEPFMTTKARSHTGLGLAVVRKIMSLYDGQLDIHSRPGEGTRVRLLFPSKQIAPAP